MYSHLPCRVPLVIEVWHKDSMAGNVLIGLCSASLVSVLAADKVQALVQVRLGELTSDETLHLTQLTTRCPHPPSPCPFILASLLFLFFMKWLPDIHLPTLPPSHSDGLLQVHLF